MIKSISIPAINSFTTGKSAISKMSRVNFIFGANGTGKTTISRLIRDEAEKPDSKILEWESDRPVKTYVYNRDFVSANFDSAEDINGIFTMGEDTVEAQRAINGINAAIEKCGSSIASAKSQIEEVEKEIQRITKKEEGICWSLKRAMPDAFKPAWEGSSGSKAAFRQASLNMVVAEETHDGAQPDKNELLAKIAVAFDDSASHVEPIPSIDASRLAELEASPILQRKVVGKSDLPIAELINRLGNIDWVSEGRKYVEGAEGRCPFCQGYLPEGFEAAIGDFFDDTFAEDMSAIESLAEEYGHVSSSYIDEVKGVLRAYAAFVDVPTLSVKLELVESVINGNKRKIADKQKSPSTSVFLDETTAIVEEVATLLAEAGSKVSAHNTIVENRKGEQSKIKAEIWRLFVHEVKPQIKLLEEALDPLQKKLEGLKKSKKADDERLAGLKSNLEIAESRLTNVKDTAKAINDLLEQLGFTNFKLDVTEDALSYRITRLNGEPASETLSEGERNLLTFLYFYHLMNGSQKASGASERRVIVIDDPISSMDANVLFVVSSLVRKLAEDARSGDGAAEQLIVLTHNISFHHEITFTPNNRGNAKTAYYLIRKVNEASRVERCEKNPVSTTYEQLWQEIFREECTSLTAQNVARRITETFFKAMEDVEPREIIDGMSGNDREIARSFLSWANAGSHILADEETFVNTDEATSTYLRVLEKIFKMRGYERHFQAMKSKYYLVESAIDATGDGGAAAESVVSE